nr:CdaR family protein [Feifania hominis]
MQNPETEKAFKNIPVRIEFAQNNPARDELSIISSKNQKIEISVRGRRSVLDNIQSAEIIAWVDLDDVTEPGEYSLPVQITMPVGDLLIERKTPSSILVRVDRIVMSEIPVQVSVSGEIDDNNYLRGQTTTDLKTIEVTGPEQELGKIAKAVVDVELQGNVSIEKQYYPYRFVDADGNTIEPEGVTSETQKIRVSVPVLRKKTVPLRVEFANMSEDWDQSVVTHTIEPDRVEIAGEESVINSISEIVVGKIDLSKVEGTAEFAFDIIYPNGVTSVDSIRSARVTVTVSGMITREFTSDQFVVENLLDSYVAEVVSDPVTVSLRGLAENLELLTDDDVTLVVDLQNKMLQPGTYEVTPTLRLTEGADVALVGELPKLKINITQP